MTSHFDTFFVKMHLVLRNAPFLLPKMQLAFSEMRLAKSEMRLAFWEEVGRLEEREGEGFSLRLAQLLVDGLDLSGGEAEQAFSVFHTLEFGFQHGVGHQEAQHLFACPHGGVALEVEAGQLGKGEWFHTTTPPLCCCRAFWMTL